MKNTTSIKVPKKYHLMIDEIFYDSDGYWAYSSKGYMFNLSDSHTAHEDTQKELLDAIRTLKPCNCSECTS
ncbi:hypothetical protein [Clostridium faecium]|uniref:Uncharacterized protein n=1 Tax=Clostridium faecium TaxID=2762223 RepID=A0ABR8YNL7_9CLOT|nr:hypothetical protein [Clostridium faecium]MBD8045832.1 hypothetical protein [Clostridium faecium]